MKICPNCHVVQQDYRTVCVDCGTRLGNKLSVEEEAQTRKEMDRKLEKLYQRRDPLFVSRADKVAGFLQLAFVPVWIVLWIWLGGMVDADGVPIPLGGIICSLLFGAGTLLPQISWELEKFFLSFRMNGAEDLTPSDFYFYGRKIAIWLVLALSALLAALYIYVGLTPEKPFDPIIYVEY